MALLLPIPESLRGHRQSPRRAAVRVGPTPKAIVLPVAWEETLVTPNKVPLLINPELIGPTHRRQTITRRKIPLALRWEPPL